MTPAPDAMPRRMMASVGRKPPEATAPLEGTSAGMMPQAGTGETEGMMAAMQGMPSRSDDTGTAAASALDRLTRPGVASRMPMGSMPSGPQSQGLLKTLGMMLGG